MSDFNRIKEVFEQKKENGYEKGLTYNDFVSIKKMLRKLENMGLGNPEVKKLYDDMNNVYSILIKNGGAKKFSNGNRDYIKEHALLLPLTLADSKKINVDIIKNQPILECTFTNRTPITITELSNRYIPNRVHHDRVEELYPDKIYDSINYISDRFSMRTNDSLELLCRVFKFQLPDQKYKFHSPKIEDFSKRYIKTFSNPDLISILDYERELLEDSGYTKVDGMDLDSLYAAKKQIIERVKSGEYEPNFVYEEPKRVILYRK